MKLLSWNVNGLRSVYKRNLLKWLKGENPAILCLQEIKAEVKDIPSELLKLQGYYSYFNPSIRRGYSGILVYSKEKAENAENSLELERFDSEGRILILKFKEFSLINIYLPHGGRQKENLSYKLQSYDFLLKKLKEMREEKVIVIGDFNIAHTELDLARPKDNKNNTMFTERERDKLDEIINLGFSDTFRIFHKEGNNFSWWPYYNNARQRNLGWRIDYIFTSKSLTPKIKDAFILKEIKGSDHCPIGVKI